MYWILGIIVSLIWGVIGLSYYLYKEKKKDKTKLSFGEGLKLTDLPIITLSCGDKNLNFMLDTGSNVSYFNKSLLKDITYEKTDLVSEMYGVEGNLTTFKFIKLSLHYKNNYFTEEFGAINLNNAFGKVKSENGVTLHGILGNEFLTKYKYILDFKDLIAYKK